MKNWVLLGKEPVEAADGPVRMRGTAAVVKQRSDGRVFLSLLAAGRLECEGRVLESDTAASLAR